MNTYEDMFTDGGILASWPDHPVRLADKSELSEQETAQPLMIRGAEFVAQGLEKSFDAIRAHKKRAAKIGALAVTTLSAGIAAGAIASHRHAH
jgi:hypothetical protein